MCVKTQTRHSDTGTIFQASTPRSRTNSSSVVFRSRGQHRRPSEKERDRQLSKLHHRGAEGMEMRLVLVAICLLLVTPIAGSFWYVYTLVYPIIRNCTLFILDLTIKSRERGGGEGTFSLIASDFLRAFENREFFDHASRAIALSLLAVFFATMRGREGKRVIKRVTLLCR